MDSKIPFLVSDVGSLICILQFRTQLSEMAGSEYGMNRKTSNTGIRYMTGPVVTNKFSLGRKVLICFVSVSGSVQNKTYSIWA